LEPLSRRIPLISSTVRAPAQALAAILAIHALVWTVLPAVLYPNLPLDLIEALIYGREWQLGYDKLPPLPWWLVEVAYRTIGHDFAYYLLAQIAVIGALCISILFSLIATPTVYYLMLRLRGQPALQKILPHE
jgi:hypothetical protein